MEGRLLEKMEVEKDLGVMISEDLKASRNFQEVYSRASRALGMMKRSIVYKTRDVLLPLYKALVRPLVEYCVPAWSPHYQKDEELLERIQHRFTRMIPGVGDLTYSE
jgi:ribonucleases P/MRP protein subunit RPP40